MLQLLNDIPNSRARQDELHHRLDHLERPARIQLLCLALDDPYPPLRHDVAEALQHELDADLTRALEDIARGKLPEPELLEKLNLPAELVPVRSERARVAACVALEASPQPEETALVVGHLLEDECADLRYQALIALYRLAPQSDALRDAVVFALTNDADSEIVVVASQIVVSRGWADLLPALVAARDRLRGEDRAQLTFSIGELFDTTDLRPQELSAPLRRDLIDECIKSLKHEPLTAAAARTLANLEAREATGALQYVLDRWFAHPILKVDAATALLSLGHPRGEEFLGQALSMRRRDARGYALRVIGKQKLSRYFDHLVAVATSDTYHADTATLALADYGSPQAHAVLEQLATSHPDSEVRELAEKALTKRLDTSALDPLMGTDGFIGVGVKRRSDTPSA